MMRIVVLGQPGAFGGAWCRETAARLAQRLDLPYIPASEAVPSADREPGWVATAAVGAFSTALLHAADTAIWLHFLPLAVTRTWAKGLHTKLVGTTNKGGQSPRLADVRDSLLHMAWTPHLHRLLHHPALAHLQIFHLRSPDETNFWLRAQEHRLPLREPTVAQPA
jgi:hypothetical protein